jgi:hypothetical protein
MASVGQNRDLDFCAMVACFVIFGEGFFFEM